MTTLHLTSALQTTKKDNLSVNYDFISSNKIVDTLGNFGWTLAEQKETRVRKPENVGFQKHFLSFSRGEPSVNGSQLRLLVVNSHDGKSSLKFHLGIFRIVCSNGLIVGKSVFEDIKIPHLKLDESKLFTAQQKIAEQGDKVHGLIEKMSSTYMKGEQIIDFAKASMELKIKYGSYNEEQQKVLRDNSLELLRIRRAEDLPLSLYEVYNTVQENIIRGGIKISGKRVRGINSIDTSINLNKDLFDLAYSVAA